MSQIKSLKELKCFIKSDLYRYTGQEFSIKIFLVNYYKVAGFRYTFWLRSSNYFYKKNRIIGIYCRLRLRHYSFKYGIQIPHLTNIDRGFYIGHFGNIVINYETIIGKNVNISQGITIGQTNRGALKGAPRIGDNVYIAPGVKIIGGITIGNNVAIGANAVVTKDIPDNAVVVGIPGRVISDSGSEGYINNKV